MSAEGQRTIAATGRTVPSHIAISRSAAFLDPTQPPRNAQVFLDAIPTVRQVPTISTWPEIEDVTGGILENALYRGDPLDGASRDRRADPPDLRPRRARRWLSPGLRLEGRPRRAGHARFSHGIDLAVAGGELLVVLGPSGAGKSTLLRVVAGLQATTAVGW